MFGVAGQGNATEKSCPHSIPVEEIIPLMCLQDDWATMSFEVAQYMESVLGTIRKQWCGVQIVMVSLLTASQDKDDMSWPNR